VVTIDKERWPMRELTWAAVLLELAYLACGILLCFLGQHLLVKGVRGDFLGEGQVASRQFRLLTSSPGLVFLIAGLAIIVVAIVRQVSIPVALRSASSTSAADTGKNKSDSTRLAEQLVIAHFVAPARDVELAGDFYDLAVDEAVKGSPAAASEALVRVIALDPARYEAASKDPRLAGLVSEPQFDAMARARLQLAVKARQEEPMSPEMRQLLAGLDIYALSISSASRDSRRAKALIDSLPAGPGMEPISVSVARLERIVSNDPAALGAAIRSSRYRWLGKEEEVQVWLRSICRRVLGEVGCPR
jgi:hypothetical protein